jgi:hypothetical protein
MGFIPDMAYLKDTIHSEDVSNFKSLDETRGKDGGYKTKVGTDFMEYRWTDIPRFTDVEKAIFVNEILGVGYPHELPKVELPKTEVKVEPIVARTDSSQKESAGAKGESIEDQKKAEVSPEQLSTLPSPLSSQKIQQPTIIPQTQQEPIMQLSSGKTTVMAGEGGAAAMTSLPAGTHADKSLEEMEKDLNAMEEQLRKLGGARGEAIDQKSAIV